MRQQVVGYSRVSSEEQAYGGHSLAAQRTEIERYCRRTRLELLDVFEDAGLSGSIDPGRRPGLSMALQALVAGRAAGLVVVGQDRLCRDVEHAARLRKRFVRRGWQLHSVTEHVDLGTASGVLSSNVKSAFDQFFRDFISERTRHALAERRRQGFRSGHVPFGYAADENGQLSPEPEEQRILRHMVRLRRAGLGPRRIVAQLNRTGMNPRTGSPWGVGSIVSILRTAERRSVEAA